VNRLRIGYLLVVAVLVIAGTWQVGQGVYIHAKAILAQQLLESAWLETRNGKQRATPWPWADTWPVARLSVPSQNVNLIVLAGDSGRTLAFGPGHNFGSVTPGEKGNSFISGHRDTHFRFLEYLQQGDRVYVDTPQGERKVYTVEQVSIVDAGDAWVESEPQMSRLSLITCYPFEAIVPGGSQRYIVSAVEVNSESNPDQSELFKGNQGHNPV
jgi:sortase A